MKRAIRPRGQVVPDGQRRADAQPRRFLLALEPAFEIARLVEHGLRPRAQRAAEIAELQPLAGAVEQAHVELALEVGQRAAGGRLRHRQLARGAAHAAQAGDGQEDLELAQGVAHIG